MKQAIAGVTPANTEETTVMVVWPSNAAFGIGRFLGRLYSIETGFYIFRLGNLLALLTSPLAAVIYFLRLSPFIGTRYRVTNRRVIVERGWAHLEDRSIQLDRFDRIDIDIRPGQAWYSAGDLMFRDGDTERFWLDGVSRPESFRQICMKCRNSYVGIQEALQNQAAVA